MDFIKLNLLVGWIGVLGGVISGAAIGLFFHQEAWMGGHSSFRRRLVRLGHISFFGLGFLNLLFAFSAKAMALEPAALRVASTSLILGAVTMPLCCFLTAWRKPFRHLFPIPVLSVAVAVVAVLLEWIAK
jgi:hypothetical protein